MCFVGQWIKVSVWSFTVRLAFFHYVKPQHITVSLKKKTRQQQQQKHLNEGWSSQLYTQLLQLGKESLKKFQLVRNSNPWPLRYRCSALPIKLHRYRRGQGNESRTSWNFFFRLSFRNCKGCVITAMIILHLIRLSVVHIIWFSYIQKFIKKNSHALYY